MGTVFYFPKLTTSATIISVVVGDKALLESNPSTATTYTGQRRLNRRLFLFSVQVVKSDKLQPSVALQIKMRPILKGLENYFKY